MINEPDKILKRPSILLVEDNVINREVIVALLLGFGLDVDSANNGLEAVQMVEAKPYSLVLMDVQMPVMDGLEATRIIRSMTSANSRNGDIPILALTATTDKEDLSACFDAGMNDIAVKPVESQNIASIINKWLEKNARVQVANSHSSPVGQSMTASVDDESLCARLACVDGIDTRTGLRNLGGDVVGYLELLHEFDEMLAHELVKLDLLVTRGETEKACAVIHTLKGVAGTLGLFGLQDCTLALEANLRGRSGDGENHADKEAVLLLHALKTQSENLHRGLQ